MNKMRARIKKENGKVYLELPSTIASQFGDYYEIEIFPLRSQMFIACTLSTKNEVFATQTFSTGANYSQSMLNDSEQSVVNKISRIRFFERNEEMVGKTLNSDEKKILEGLINRRVVVLFKSAKYPNGVYNISNKIYFSNKQQRSMQNRALDSAVSGGNTSKDKQTFDPNAIEGPALAINTIEHLKKLGYMVLSNESEAKYQMQNIKSEIKDDEVRGVRGFDKKYYILRKSFLREFEQPIFSLLDEGLSVPREMSERIKLTSEAITVVLMVMADEGLVIEKRRGEWAKA